MIEEQVGETHEMGTDLKADDRPHWIVSRWVQQFLEKVFHWETGPFQGF